MNYCTSPNRAYMASVLRTYAQILLRRTSDTLETLAEIGLKQKWRH
jgi:hypothetical protein